MFSVFHWITRILLRLSVPVLHQISLFFHWLNVLCFFFLLLRQLYNGFSRFSGHFSLLLTLFLLFFCLIGFSSVIGGFKRIRLFALLIQIEAPYPCKQRLQIPRWHPRPTSLVFFDVVLETDILHQLLRRRCLPTLFEMGEKFAHLAFGKWLAELLSISQHVLDDKDFSQVRNLMFLN